MNSSGFSINFGKSSEKYIATKQPSEFAKGTTVDDSGIKVTLVDFSCKVKTPPGALPPEGKYCIATLKLDNQSGQALENYHYWWDKNSEVIDSLNRIFPMAFVGDTDKGYDFNTTMTFDQYLKGVGPGFSKTYRIPFDLPLDAEAIKFKYRGSYSWSDVITFDLRGK